MEQIEIKVSIIIPVYNTPERALRKCIESAIKQSMKNIEIIIVDDGSSDNSGNICDEYAEFDKRICVIHKRNKGLAAARNTGYKKATGTWITFLDADDWIEPITCERTVSKAEENKADVLIFGVVQEIGCKRNFLKCHFKNGQIFVGEECHKLQHEILNFNGNIAMAWAKLINRDFLNKFDIQHNSLLRQGSEGIEFNLRMFGKAKKVYFINNPYYHYVYNPDSISAKHNEKNHYYVIRCFEMMRKEIINEFKDIKLYVQWCNRVMCVIIAAAVTGYFNPLNTEKFSLKVKKYKKYLKQKTIILAMQGMDFNGLDIQRKIVLILIRLHCWRIIGLIAKIRFKQKQGKIL